MLRHLSAETSLLENRYTHTQRQDLLQNTHTPDSLLSYVWGARPPLGHENACRSGAGIRTDDRGTSSNRLESQPSSRCNHGSWATTLQD